MVQYRLHILSQTSWHWKVAWVVQLCFLSIDIMTHPIKDSFAPLSTHKAHDQQIHKHVLRGCSDVTVTGDHCPNKIGLDLSVKVLWWVWTQTWISTTCTKFFFLHFYTVPRAVTWALCHETGQNRGKFYTFKSPFWNKLGTGKISTVI